MNGDPLDELDEAGDKITRLRLTDEEREAIRLGNLAYPGLRITNHGRWVEVWAVLQRLAARHAAT